MKAKIGCCTGCGGTDLAINVDGMYVNPSNTDDADSDFQRLNQQVLDGEKTIAEIEEEGCIWICHGKCQDETSVTGIYFENEEQKVNGFRDSERIALEIVVNMLKGNFEFDGYETKDFVPDPRDSKDPASTDFSQWKWSRRLCPPAPDENEWRPMLTLFDSFGRSVGHYCDDEWCIWSVDGMKKLKEGNCRGEEEGRDEIEKAILELGLINEIKPIPMTNLMGQAGGGCIIRVGADGGMEVETPPKQVDSEEQAFREFSERQKNIAKQDLAEFSEQQKQKQQSALIEFAQTNGYAKRLAERIGLM